MFLNVVPIVCIIIELPNFGKSSHFVSDCQSFRPKFLIPVRLSVVGGLWVRLGKSKCGVFGSACALAKHLF
jgi:hypothetical protein